MKSALTVLAVLALASPAFAAEASASGAVDPLVFRVAVFVLAAFIGYYVVWAVTPALHTPLMSVTNAISGVVVVGAIIAATASAVQVTDPETSQRIWIAKGLGAASIGFAAVNIFGGFLVTNRMLAMYKKKDRPANS
ncbi:MAG: NAD(P) transhydrogenase subunit alpha [Pseudomonadota bacterium]